MGFEYALVHLYYTIPPAIALTLLYRPLFTAIDVYKILFLVAIAVTATIPWDSYLIRSHVWSYPPNVIVGPTLFEIPAEELFFFVIQTYNTSLLYIIFSKPTFHPVYLRAREEDKFVTKKSLGFYAILGVILWGVKLVQDGTEGLYMGLIIVWAGPFILVLWSLAYQFVIGLPLTNTVLPVVLPTAYLWLVDTLALRRGTWVIENGTKLGWQLWNGLEIEEAFFFLVTNILIVFGLVAFDNALAVLYTFPTIFPSVPSIPSPQLLIRALFVPTKQYEALRLEAFRDAIIRLRSKSRSFYLASGVFQGRLRHDLILLYSFCRVADDLVDTTAASEGSARIAIRLLKDFLELSYMEVSAREKAPAIEALLEEFPEFVRPALRYLPTSYLSPEPFYELLQGFEMDLEFTFGSFPISSKDRLTKYGERVAGTVAELIIQLSYHHSERVVEEEAKLEALKAGRTMGIALQLVNIARDIAVDAVIARVYMPTTWLHELGLRPEDILKDPSPHEKLHAGEEQVIVIREKLLDYAMELYRAAVPKIELLPPSARNPMRVAVESYMEIGRVLREPGYQVKAGRATVPLLRRILVARKALCT